ncbi:MAG: NADH-quinone oxidoreductase subunit H [Polyangiaceae bacterium]
MALRQRFSPLFLALPLVLAPAMGCDPARNVPELLQVSDVTPRVLGPGERVEIDGTNLPVGQVSEARVVFAGSLHRPGLPVVDGVHIEVGGATVEREKISFMLDDATMERFTGRGDEAEHTTFRGRVEVWVPGASSKMPVYGTIKGEVVLDFHPRTAARHVREAREAEAREAARFMGLAVEKTERGLTVARVEPNRPAARAGLEVGDRILSFDEITAEEPTDLVPGGSLGPAAIVYQRTDKQGRTAIDTRGFREDSVEAYTWAIVLLASLAGLLLLFGSRLGAWLSWVSARIRDGIARARRPDGSWLAAVVRAAATDATAPASTTSSLGAVAPWLVFAGVSATFALLPIIELSGRVELDLGILYLLSVTVLAAMGVVTGGRGTPRSILLSRARSAAEILLCELPAASAMAVVIVTTGSLRLRDVVVGQTGTQLTVTEVGGWPWFWNALRSPQLFVLFALFFVTAMVDSSPRTARGERPGIGALAFHFAEWTHIFIMCAIGAMAFLGGYSLPGVSMQQLSQGGPLAWLAALVFLVKSWGLALAVLTVRACLPRIRPDVLLRVGLRRVVPACVAALAITAVWVQYPMVPTIERVVGLTTLATVAGTLAILALSAQEARRREDARLRSRVNPFL